MKGRDGMEENASKWKLGRGKRLEEKKIKKLSGRRWRKEVGEKKVEGKEKRDR